MCQSCMGKQGGGIWETRNMYLRGRHPVARFHTTKRLESGFFPQNAVVARRGVELARRVNPRVLRGFTRHSRSLHGFSKPPELFLVFVPEPRQGFVVAELFTKRRRQFHALCFESFV